MNDHQEICFTDLLKSVTIGSVVRMAVEAIVVFGFFWTLFRLIGV